MRARVQSLLFVLIVLCSAHPLVAQRIGAAWEFNQDGDAEGWQAHRSIAELTVANGKLCAVTNSYNPTLAGPEISLDAADFGFIDLRIKAPGSSSVKIYWINDLNESGSIAVALQGDSLFHDYEIPVLTRQSWRGRIVTLSKLLLNAPPPSSFCIDYLRIVAIGTRFNIKTIPLRTVLKQNDRIPVIAVVQNSGDRSSDSYHIELKLPDPVELVEGVRIQSRSGLAVQAFDTLRWVLRSTVTGEFDIQTLVFSDTTDSTTAGFKASFVDCFWSQDRFILSAWGPPEQNEAEYTEYRDAYFNTIAYTAPSVSAVDFVGNHNMICFLNVSHVIRGDIRAPEDKVPSEITDADLSGLDPIVDSFRDYPHIIGYHITDEPNAKAFANLGKVVDYLRQRNPLRVAYINLFPTYAQSTQLGVPGYDPQSRYDEHVRLFMEIVKPELLSYDHYNFFINNRDGYDYFMNLEIIRKYALLYDVPFCNIIQAIGSLAEEGQVWRTLHEGELRWLAHSSLAYGAKSLIYFSWGSGPFGFMNCPEREQVYSAVRQVNSEIMAFAPILMELESTRVYHLNGVPAGTRSLPTDAWIRSATPAIDLLLGMFRDSSGNDYVMMMNKDYSEVKSARIQIDPGIEKLSLFDLETAEWQPVSIVPDGELVSFEAEFLPGGANLYQIGRFSAVVAENGLENPENFTLFANYPNPFNPQTTISFSLSRTAQVKLAVYNPLGQEIAVLTHGRRPAGEHRIVWNAADVPSGVYLYRLQCGDRARIGKMLLMK
ncbi:T9SS type A sorting domain-containing protein [candidate division KSB1 bacterium]|nr:T9SS type A sorting domain-containing protein [candidate division KSB1 bacterium]